MRNSRRCEKYAKAGERIPVSLRDISRSAEAGRGQRVSAQQRKADSAQALNVFPGQEASEQPRELTMMALPLGQRDESRLGWLSVTSLTSLRAMGAYGESAPADACHRGKDVVGRLFGKEDKEAFEVSSRDAGRYRTDAHDPEGSIAGGGAITSRTAVLFTRSMS
jgi:hypothetical protein